MQEGKEWTGCVVHVNRAITSVGLVGRVILVRGCSVMTLACMILVVMLFEHGGTTVFTIRPHARGDVFGPYDVIRATQCLELTLHFGEA